jgi:hypothetical protein
MTAQDFCSAFENFLTIIKIIKGSSSLRWIKAVGSNEAREQFGAF